MTASRTLHDDIDLLGGLLGEVIQAQEPVEAFALEERARTLGKALRSGDETAARATDRAGGGPVDRGGDRVGARIHELLPPRQPRRGQRARAPCPHARARSAPAPRRGSLREAIGIIAARGTSAESLRELLAQAEIRLVLTAHPTEARRRTTVAKLARIFAAIRELDERELEAGRPRAGARTTGEHDPGAVELG